MSGFEIVGAVAAAEGLIKGSITLFTFVHDVLKAGEEREELESLLQGTGGLTSQLQLLKKRAEEADKADKDEAFLFEGLLQLRNQYSSEEKEKLLGDNIGALAKMQVAMTKMQKELDPGHGVSKHLKRYKWSKDKSDVEKLMEDIRTWKGQVDWALQYDHHTATMATYALVKENAADTKQLVAQVKEHDADTKQLLARGDVVESQLRKLDLRLEEQKTRDEKRELELQRDRLEKEQEKREKIVEDIANWLSPLDFQSKHSELLEVENRVDMTEDLRKTIEFQTWRSGKPWVLYCYAEAGAGKTMLTSMIIEHLQTHFKDKNIPVLNIYLNHREQKAHTLVNLYGSLLKQLIMYKKPPIVSEELVDLYNQKAGKTRLTAEKKKEAFCKELRRFDRVMIVVDALDEGSQTIQQAYYDLISELQSNHLSVMVTSRREGAEKIQGMSCDRCGAKPIDIYYRCSECDPYFYMCYDCKSRGEICNNASHILEDPITNEEIFLNVNPSSDAIQKYVEREIRKETKGGRTPRARDGLYKSSGGPRVLARLKKDDPDLEKLVIEQVVIKANDKFLLAKLYVDSLKLKLTKADIKRAIKNLPEGYADTYEQTMKRIQQRKDADSTLFRRVATIVSWIVEAHRYLTLEEFRHALATTPEEGFDEDAMIDRETLLEITSGLVVISNEKVILPHYTAYEYFSGDGRKWFDWNIPALIARTCLEYIAIPDLCKPLPRDSELEEFEDRNEEYPFLAYAYEYWGLHAKEARSDEETSEKALELLRNPASVNVFVQALWYVESAEASRWEIRKGATALHVAAWFGLTDTISTLVKEDGIDVDSQDPGLEQTPLIYASRRGHVDTVRKLLELRASPNKVSAYGNTALYEAFWNHQFEVGQALLENLDLDINYRYLWKMDRTILIEATTQQDSAFVNLILDSKKDEVDVNLSGSDENTALALACAHGNTMVVARLLDHPGIDVNLPGQNGVTALSLAACAVDQFEAADVVKLLLEHGAVPTLKDKEGGNTPMLQAANEGNLQVVEALFGHDSRLLDDRDDEGRGVLHAAAIASHAHIVPIAVHNGIDVNVIDSRRRTPLHDAARAGSEQMITALLDQGAKSMPDQSGREPREVAWQNGHHSVLHTLNPDLPPLSPPDSQIPSSSLPKMPPLPLWALVQNAREDQIRELVENEPSSFRNVEVDPDTGDTAIHCAINIDNLSILTILLETGMPATVPNAIKRTPLHAAAVSPNKELMNVLLSTVPRTKQILNSPDRNNSTPLWLAFRYALPHAACALVAAGATIEKKSMIQPLFFNAIEYGYLEAVRILLDKYKAPANAKNSKGESAMVVAKSNGWMEILKLLVRVKSRFVRAREADEGEEEGEAEATTMWEGEDLKVPFPRPEDLDEDDEVEEAEELEELGTQQSMAQQRQEHNDERVLVAA